MAIMNKITNGHEFVAEFAQWSERKDQFSRAALCALYGYLDELSDDIGEDIELDVVGLCCEWSEYKDIEAVKEDYEIEGLSDLQDSTTVVEFDGGLLVHEF
jgi:hypothetical protein